MVSADVLHIDAAAEMLGVSTDALLQRLDGGDLPEAVRLDGTWCVPAVSLAAIAEREGWPAESGTDRLAARQAESALDLTAGDRTPSETAAAHAAVVMAKTQASAARAEADDLGRHVQQLTAEVERLQADNERLASKLSAAARAQAVLERDRAVSEARADELRRQVDQERVERSMLAARIGALEADREDAIGAMDRWSRRRYERRQSRTKTSPPPKWIQDLQGDHSR
ncbi:MAG: hypothetical protein AAGD35_01690 [Actinomycetota bacterium]